MFDIIIIRITFRTFCAIKHMYNNLKQSTLSSFCFILISCLMFLSLSKNFRFEELKVLNSGDNLEVDLSSQKKREVVDSLSNFIGQNDCTNSMTNQKWLNATLAARQCFAQEIKRFSGKLWQNLHVITPRCSEKLRKLLKVIFLENRDDVKGFIDFSKNNSALLNNKEDCVAVTIGIGGDILAEEQLKKLAPFCKFYGADPVLASGIAFQKLGTYFQVAVSNVSGNQSASVLEDPSQIFKYNSRHVPTLEFHEFLQRKVNATIVDVLLLDGEGAEYVLLPYFLRRPNGTGSGTDSGRAEPEFKIDLEPKTDPKPKSNSEAENTSRTTSTTTVCQLSIELHGKPIDYGLNSAKWESLITEFLTNSEFLVLWTPYPGNHHRMFAVNTENPACFRKFYSQHYC